jgi:tetratricopeptide (TPR) repeat protein
MEQNPNINPKHITNLFLNEVIEIFSRIDTQIGELHQCSSDDFLGLNADFKGYYKQSKAISENATEIFQSLTETQLGDLIANLEDLYRELKTSQMGFSKLLQESIALLKEMDHQLDNLFLPLKNLNQDLMSLKLLSANIKISSSTSVPNVINSIEDALIQLNALINEFKTVSFQNETNLSGLKELVRQTIDAFNGFGNRNIHDLDSILNHIHYGIILFAEKHEEASMQIPELTAKTKSTSNSIADIVTNLQYHDIIRQKMEHIQATQKRLLGELQQASNANVNSLSEEDSQLVSRIRDIAGLQSAQLIRANKEYQQAIEKITERFLALGDDMTTISQMCLLYSVSNDNNEELQLQKLLLKLESSADVLSNFLKAGKSYTSSLDLLNGSIDNTSNGMRDLKSSIEELKRVIEKTNSAASGTTNPDLGESVSNLLSLFNDVIKFEETIQNVFLNIQKIGSKLLENTTLYESTLQKTGSFALASKSMNSIISTLSEKNIRIQYLLDQNHKISHSISNDVRESVKKVKYYDFFDTNIVKIISELNLIHNKLKLESEQEQIERDENLKKIKSLYTMASEHEIHDKVVSSNDNSEFFEEAKPEETDDDNVEFF